MRKRTKRKVYELVNPIVHAIEGAAITPESRLAELQIRELGSIDAMTKGHGTLQDYSNLCALQGLAETMAKEGIGPEALEATDAAQSVLLAMRDRFEASGRFTLYAAEIQTLRDLYEYHQLQRTSVSRSEYERMIALATARMKTTGKGVKVIV